MKIFGSWWRRPDMLADIVAGLSAFGAVIINIASALNFIQASWFQSNINNITLGLLGIFIVVAIIEKRVFATQLRRDLISELEKVQVDDLHARIRAAGISNLYLNRSDYAKFRGAVTLEDYLGSAHSTAKVVAHWLAQGIEMEGVANSIAHIVRSGKTVEIAVVDPNSTSLPQIASFFSMAEEVARERILNTISELLNIKNAMSEEDKKRFIIKTYDTLAAASVIMLDDYELFGRIQVDIKVYQTPRQKSFGFELSGRGNPLYDLWRDAYTNLLENAREVSEMPRISVKKVDSNMKD